MPLSRRLVAPLVCALAALSGACTSTPDGPDPRPTAAGITAGTPAEPLTEAEMPAFWADFDSRLNEALRRGLLPPYPAEALAAYATGPELAVGEFNVALAEAGREVRSPPPVGHAGERLYAGRFVAHPTWVMAGASATTAGPGEGTAYAGISVFTRGGDGADWLLAAFVPMTAAAMPAPDAGADDTPAASAVVRANELGVELDSYWETGREPAGLVLDPALRAVREALVTPGSPDVAAAELSVERYPGAPTYAVRVEGATLAMLSFRASVTYRARPGRTLRWSGPRALLYGEGPQRELVTDYVFNALVSMPADGGPARVLGLGLPEILTARRETA